VLAVPVPQRRPPVNGIVEEQQDQRPTGVVSLYAFGYARRRLSVPPWCVRCRRGTGGANLGPPVSASRSRAISILSCNAPK
jgi:hypothetical protein